MTNGVAAPPGRRVLVLTACLAMVAGVGVVGLGIGILRSELRAGPCKSDFLCLHGVMLTIGWAMVVAGIGVAAAAGGLFARRRDAWGVLIGAGVLALLTTTPLAVQAMLEDLHVPGPQQGPILGEALAAAAPLLFLVLLMSRPVRVALRPVRAPASVP